jgi:hypothetical protein
MTKMAIGFTVVFISLLMAVPLSAKGPAAGKNGQSRGALTEKEIKDITYIREEEKLARDVYLTLYELYQAPIFANISESEQRHMDALERLIEKYELEDPVEDDTVGVFPPVPEQDTDTDFNDLYDELVDLGGKSYCEALQVGIDIELLDIDDIEIALEDVVAQDVNRVLNNLLNGSYNHLNAFTSQSVAEECPIKEVP